MIELSDADLNRMRTDTESNFVERKTVHNTKGWLRTAVAFANSAPIGAPAVLFVGVNNDGTFENVASDYDWEKLQKTITQELNRAYPWIYSVQKIVNGDQGGQCLAVIIWGSPERPHFTGKSYIRKGPETTEASDREFDALIAERSSKAYEIRKWIGEQIVVAQFVQGMLTPQPVTLLDCNQYYFSVEYPGPVRVHFSYPLTRTEVSFHHVLNCLQLEVRDLA